MRRRKNSEDWPIVEISNLSTMLSQNRKGKVEWILKCFTVPAL